MSKKLRLLFDALRSSLWFLPALLVVGAISLAMGLIEVDWLNREELSKRWPRLLGASADGSRTLLSAIATSMMTVVGVSFSITVVTLALASSQYTSRILRNFMRDRANQLVLGVFVGVFAYCLVVLRTIRGGEDGVFVPALAVLVAVLLSFAAIGFLIFFIHHTAASIQATTIISGVASETLATVDRLYPIEMGAPASEQTCKSFDAPSEESWAIIRASKTGYLRDVDGDALFAIAPEQGVIVRMEKAIGDFVIEATPLASVAGKAPDDELTRKVNAAYMIGQDRTVHQDAAYGIRQIVDIALKALSPGVNDTTTAVNCLDFLGAILSRLAARQIEPRYRSDDDGHLRVIARGATFAGLVNAAFEQIRQNGSGNVAVLVRLLEVLELLRRRTVDPDRRSALRQHVDLIDELATRTVPAAHDLARVRAARAADTFERMVVEDRRGVQHE